MDSSSGFYVQSLWAIASLAGFLLNSVENPTEPGAVERSRVSPRRLFVRRCDSSARPRLAANCWSKRCHCGLRGTRPSRTNSAFLFLCVFLFPPSSSSVWAPQQMDAGDKGPGFRSIWRVRLEAFTSWWLQTGSRQSSCQEKRLWNNTATKISYTLI